MFKILSVGVVAACTAAAWPPDVVGQGRGRGGQAAPNVPTDAQYAASKDAQRHIAAAMALAKGDLVAEAKEYCSPTGPQRDTLTRQQRGLPPIPNERLEPTRIFDNLYFIGFTDVGAWAIPTSAGIILIDALNTTNEARDVLVPDLKKVGLDPAEIKYVVVGHGHGDHFGGAAYLQTTYGARVLMGAPDWKLAMSAARPDRPAPKRDIDVTDGQKLMLGDTMLTLAITPGHTPSSLAILIPVKYRGQTHTAMVMSGIQMPTRESLATFEHVFNDFARPQKAETALGSHPGTLINDLAGMEALRRQYLAEPHPFLLGPERFDRYMSIMLECAKARLAAIESTKS